MVHCPAIFIARVITSFYIFIFDRNFHPTFTAIIPQVNTCLKSEMKTIDLRA